jgi:hypothetical protein
MNVGHPMYTPAVSERTPEGHAKHDNLSRPEQQVI